MLVSKLCLSNTNELTTHVDALPEATQPPELVIPHLHHKRRRWSIACIMGPYGGPFFVQK